MASKDTSKCPVCKDDIQEATTLPCQHKLCEQCLTQHVSASASSDKTFQCPTCCMTCKVTDEGGVKAASSKPSGDPAPFCVKKEHGSATVFCCDCDKFFCEKCISQHQGCDWMSDHKQRPVKEMSSYDIKYAQSAGSRKTCPEHELPITMLCKTCKTVICHTCLRYKHKDHEDQELVESTTEAKKGMNNMTDEAKKVISKQNDALKETGQTKETIRKDVKEAKESVKKRAQKICDTVREHEKNLLDDLDRYEEEAIKHLEDIEDSVKVCKAETISLQNEVSSLLQYGKPIEQVERTPVLQEKLDAQQNVKTESMTWKYVCQRKELDEESVKSMLGDVKLATRTLGQPLQQVPLKYTGNQIVTGMVVVGDCLCVVHAADGPNIWLYNITNSENKTCAVPDLEDPNGMALMSSSDRTVVITDQNTKGGQIHFVKITDDMDISLLSSMNIALKNPRRISVSLDNSELIIGQWDGPKFLVCDLQGNAQRQVTVTSPDGTERFPWCVQQTASDYAAVMWDKDWNSIIQWLGEDGSGSHSYGHKAGERVRKGHHMVRDSAGQLIVVDFGNDRLHLVDNNGKLVQFLLTKDDGIVDPQCVYLNETAGRLYVSHGKIGSMEVRVNKWPPKSGEYRLERTV